MSSFIGFDDFRIGAWMDDCFLIGWAEVGEKVKSTIKKAATDIAVATTFIAASAISVPATAAADSFSSPNVQFSESASLHQELQRMAASVDSELMKLPDVTEASIDQDLLALAQQALTASKQRSSRTPLEIAEAFFPRYA
jgi:hypothetical protein